MSNFDYPVAYLEDSDFTKEGELSNKEIPTDMPVVVMLQSSWCGHCKKAKPIWDALKEKYHGKQINNNTVYFKYINCEEDEGTADKYKIEGYPTIKLVKDNEIIEFDAKPTEETLTQFLHSTL